jgi:hypothetical protein
MRTCKQVREPQRDAECDRHAERPAGKVACDPEAHDKRRARGGGGGQQHDAAPPAAAEGKRQQDFREPLVRDPGRARHRMAERVGARHGGVGDDPFAGRQMRPRVSVSEHSRRESGKSKQENRDKRKEEP